MVGAAVAAVLPERPTAAIAASRVGQRLLFLALVAGYYASFIWTYDTLLEPGQGFWGFSRNEVAWEYQLLNWVMVLLPGLWLPLELRRPSQLLFLLQYLVLFVPATVVLYNSGLPRLQADEALRLLLLMFGCLSLLQLIYYVPLLRLAQLRVSVRAYWWVFYSVMALLGAYIAASLASNLKFIGIAEMIYASRIDATEMVARAGGSALLWYVVGWYIGMFLPVAFAAAVARRSALTAALVIACYLFLFGVTGTKTVLLAGLILWGLSQLVRLRQAWFSTGFVVGLSLLLLIPVAFEPFGDLGETMQTWYVALVHARIFGEPQLILAQYYAFFQQHPLTWWSHITGVDAMVNFPYAKDVPYTTGFYYYAIAVGLNSGMWIEDGIGAAGIGGVFIITVVAAAVLWLFDSMSARAPARFVACASAVVAIDFLNVPLTTTLITGGWAPLALAIYLMPPEAAAERTGHGRRNASDRGT